MVVNVTTIVLVLAIIILGPLLIIWSLNTLFALHIEYNLATWFAALTLGVVVKRVWIVER